MRSRGALAITLALLVVPVTDAGASDPLQVPPARVGDRWSVDVAGDLHYDHEVTGRTSALDRWGRERDVFAVSVEGFSPLMYISMRTTEHEIHVDAASGVAVADVITGHLDLGVPASQPGAYSAFSPNDTDGYPGWILAGGLLAGRRLEPGGTVALPMIVTRTRGNDRIVLSIDEAPSVGGARCVRAIGTAAYPTYLAYQDGLGYDRGEVRVSVDTVQCDDSPYAVRTRVTYAGSFTHSVEAVRSAFERGTGDAIGTAPFQEPEHHALATPVPFDGTLRDGGGLPIVGIEEAQEAAEAAPGLAVWRVAHPDGFLVEADYTAAHADDPALVAAGRAAEQWRLVYAAPSGDRHEVRVRDQDGLLVAVDVPQAQAYPAGVPPLGAWPPTVVTAADVLAAWRQLAGSGARLDELRWEPLLDQRWHVVSRLENLCAEDECGSAVTGLDMMFHVETGEAMEGLHPLD